MAPKHIRTFKHYLLVSEDPGTIKMTKWNSGFWCLIVECHSTELWNPNDFASGQYFLRFDLCPLVICFWCLIWYLLRCRHYFSVNYPWWRHRKWLSVSSIMSYSRWEIAEFCLVELSRNVELLRSPMLLFLLPESWFARIFACSETPYREWFLVASRMYDYWVVHRYRRSYTTWGGLSWVWF